MATLAVTCFALGGLLAVGGALAGNDRDLPERARLLAWRAAAAGGVPMAVGLVLAIVAVLR